MGRAFPGRSAIGGGEGLSGSGGPFAFAVDGPGVAARAFDGRGVRALAGKKSSGDFPGGRLYGTECQPRGISFLFSGGRWPVKWVAPSGPQISN